MSYTEAELLSASKYVVVLAKPGGGKLNLWGALLNSWAKVVTANKFRYGAQEVALYHL
jgi:hypothetical protein